MRCKIAVEVLLIIIIIIAVVVIMNDLPWERKTDGRIEREKPIIFRETPSKCHFFEPWNTSLSIL